MSKKQNQVKKVVGINDIKNTEKEAVVIENVDDAQDILSRSLVEALTDQLIESLSGGFEREMLALLQDDITDIAFKLLKNEITNDEYQEQIGRLIINKLAPNTRVYTDNDVTKLIELGENLTMDKLENIGISKKELRDHIGIFAEHMHEKYGFIKERLQNKVYKFLRDNWKLERKVLDAKLRNLILKESHDHLDETQDARIMTISNDLGDISLSSIFTVDEMTTDDLINTSKDLLDKVATGEVNEDEFKKKFREGIRRLEEAHSAKEEKAKEKASTKEDTKAKEETIKVHELIAVPSNKKEKEKEEVAVTDTNFSKSVNVIDDFFSSTINAVYAKRKAN